MKLVVDTNVLFSFFKRDSTTRELISDFRTFDLYSAGFALQELEKHKQTILKKAKISDKEFDEIAGYLKTLVTFVPLSEYQDKLAEAKNVSPDPDDVDFFALALHLKCNIWSNEEVLKEQSVIGIFTTEKLVKNLGLV